MAKVGSLVEPKFLNGEMLGATPQIITIKKAGIEKLGDEEEERVVVSFFELEKPLPCNKTQLRALIEFLGDETDIWPNHQVMAYGEKLKTGQFAGKWTIHITAPPAQPFTPIQPPVPEQQPAQEQLFPVQPDGHTI